MALHLCVLVHGMWGNPGHLAQLERILCETKAQQPSEDSTQLHILVASTNSDQLSYDGIDIGAERVTNEICATVAHLERHGRQVTKFSITGYSLGGLISRYVVGILYHRGFFDKVQPVNFNTIATPHIGLAKYHPLFWTLAKILGPVLMSRTGEQMYWADNWCNTGRTLLEVMADPDQIFYQALTKFRHLRLYANAVHDMSVPFFSAAIETFDPFSDYAKNGIHIFCDQRYPPIVKSYYLPPSEQFAPPPPRSLFDNLCLFYRRPFVLPTFLINFGESINAVLYGIFVLCIPLVFTLMLLYLYTYAEISRARLKMMEKEGSSGNKLLHSLVNIEKKVEDAVADFMDDRKWDVHLNMMGTNAGPRPYLTPAQLKMAESLNKLPFRKVFVFFPDIFNTHGIIIARDVKQFPYQRRGEDALRHWADCFAL